MARVARALGIPLIVPLPMPRALYMEDFRTDASRQEFESLCEGSEVYELGVVDGSARQAGLGSAMKRVKPDGKSGVRVWFEGVSFDSLVGWLATLSDQQVTVRSLSLERPGEPGRVNAQLTLEVAG